MHRHVALQGVEELLGLDCQVSILLDSDVGWLQLIMLLFHLGLGKECKSPRSQECMCDWAPPRFRLDLHGL